MKEIWKDIKGYEGLYQVSNFGEIKSLGRKYSYYSISNNLVNGRRFPRKLKQGVRKDGYLFVALVKNKNKKYMSTHRIVALNFLTPIKGKNQVNHKDGDKKNNQVKNLEWCTGKENVYHSRYILKRGLKPVLQYDCYGKLINQFESIVGAGESSGVAPQHIWRCCNNIRKSAGGFFWKYKNNPTDKSNF